MLSDASAAADGDCDGDGELEKGLAATKREVCGECGESSRWQVQTKGGGDCPFGGHGGLISRLGGTMIEEGRLSIQEKVG